MSEVEEYQSTALFTHLCTAYDYLHDHSEVNEYGERLYEGSLVHALSQATSAKAYYSPIRRLLESPAHNPCIEIYQRGTAKQPSIIRLLHRPPPEWEKIPLSGLTNPALGATMGSDIERRLASLEARFNPLKEVNLVEVLKDYERRLRRLESQTQ